MAEVDTPAPARPVTPVGILTAILVELRDRLATVDDLDPELAALAVRAAELSGGLDPYVGRCTSPESPALRQLAERTAGEDWSAWAGDRGRAPLEQEMLSGHVEGQLLKTLVHATQARRVLEIGMFTGYSALAVAEALPDGGRVVACEIDARVAAFARRCLDESAHGTKVDIRVAPALETLDGLTEAGATFDLVFIDADKAGYPAYLDAVLQGGLLAPHGLVCVDNTLMQGQPWTSGPVTTNGTAVAAFNQAVAADDRVEQVLLPVRDGVTLIRPASRG